LVEMTWSVLGGGELDEIGGILDEGWRIKRSLVDGISNPEIDVMYRKAIQAGARGGKICGAGGGGFLFLYCNLEHQDRVREVMNGYRELQFSFSRDGTKAIFNIRR